MFTHIALYLSLSLPQSVTEKDIEDKPSGSLAIDAIAAASTRTKGRFASIHGKESEKEDAGEVVATTTTKPAVVAYDIEEDENAGSVQLPADAVNGSRCIPAVCTICLCPYENGDQVSWSPDTACQHAFHRDCIISWLAKKEEPKCPICRQDFCQLGDFSEEPEQAQAQVPTLYSYSQSLAQALALSRVEAEAYERDNANAAASEEPDIEMAESAPARNEPESRGIT